MSSREARLELVAQAFGSLPGRYLGAERGFGATFHIRLGDIGHSWEVRADEHAARVRQGVTSRVPDVTIATDSQTWIALRDGELSGLEAFAQRRLAARGNLDLAVGFEGLFRRQDGGEPLLRVHEVKLTGARLSAMTIGRGRDVLLLHGLGSTKASLYETAAALSSAGYRAHAIDLPGFGSSSKPATAPYSPQWFANVIREWMDAMEIGRAHLVGNSMGGRVALELAMADPHRVRALALLCPAVAFIRRDFHPLVRLSRPEFGLLPHRLRRSVVEQQFWSMFADRDLIDPSVADVAVDEFLRIYGSRGARLAFLAAARNIYLDRPFGREGFYPRLAELQPPALFVWGSHDKLIPPAFKPHVARWLPRAEQIVLQDCGHVPQIERPEQTNALLGRFFAQADALLGPATAGRAAA